MLSVTALGSERDRFLAIAASIAAALTLDGRPDGDDHAAGRHRRRPLFATARNPFGAFNRWGIAPLPLVRSYFDLTKSGDCFSHSVNLESKSHL